MTTTFSPVSGRSALLASAGGKGFALALTTLLVPAPPLETGAEAAVEPDASGRQALAVGGKDLPEDPFADGADDDEGTDKDEAVPFAWFAAAPPPEAIPVGIPASGVADTAPVSKRTARTELPSLDRPGTAYARKEAHSLDPDIEHATAAPGGNPPAAVLGQPSATSSVIAPAAQPVVSATTAPPGVEGAAPLSAVVLAVGPIEDSPAAKITQRAIAAPAPDAASAARAPVLAQSPLPPSADVGSRRLATPTAPVSPAAPPAQSSAEIAAPTARAILSQPESTAQPVAYPSPILVEVVAASMPVEDGGSSVAPATRSETPVTTPATVAPANAEALPIENNDRPEPPAPRQTPGVAPAVALDAELALPAVSTPAWRPLARTVGSTVAPQARADVADAPAAPLPADAPAPVPPLGPQKPEVVAVDVPTGVKVPVPNPAGVTDQPAPPRTEATGAATGPAQPQPIAFQLQPTPQTSLQPFVAPLIAAQIDVSTPRRTAPRDPAPTPVAFAAGDAPHIPIAAPGETQHAPLDLRRHEWMGAMLDRIEAMRDSSGPRETSIRLAPDALGSLDISIRQEGDRIHVRFSADTPAARAALTEAQPRLAELAEARGLRLGQTSVDAGTAGHSGQHQQTAQATRSSAPPSARAESQPESETDQRIA